MPDEIFVARHRGPVWPGQIALPPANVAENRLTRTPPLGPVAIDAPVLGVPGRDNVLLATLATGTKTHKLLFDCGAGCLGQRPIAEIQKIDTIFFSHFHYDHIGGFDDFVRLNFDRAGAPVQIFGPRGSARIIGHRLQGVQWDRVEDATGAFRVTEIDGTRLVTSEFRCSEGFELQHEIDEQPFRGRVVDNEDFSVDAVALEHGSPSIGYIVRQKDRLAVDTAKLQRLGLPRGPWLSTLKDPKTSDETAIQIGNDTHRAGDIRAAVCTVKRGESLGYLTDFTVTDACRPELLRLFRGCNRLVCENNYRDMDVELARRNFHLTSSQVAHLARDLGVTELTVFHLSDRYDPGEWRSLLAEVRAIFTNAYFPTEWEKHFDTDRVLPGPMPSATSG